MAGLNGWRAPSAYKTISDAEKDVAIGLKQIADGISILTEVAKTLNKTNPGQGDILFGVAATIQGTVDGVLSSQADIKKSMRGEAAKSFASRKYMQLAIRQAPDTRTRREVRDRLKHKKAT